MNLNFLNTIETAIGKVTAVRIPKFYIGGSTDHMANIVWKAHPLSIVFWRIKMLYIHWLSQKSFYKDTFHLWK